MRIRFRIDGVLQEAARVPKRMVAGVVSRIKIMSELDIAEKRIPQDGRVGVAVDDRRVDLRVTTLPTQRGEGASIRILDEAHGAADARRPRHGGGPARALRDVVPAALRGGAGHRAHRRRQVDHPLRGAAGPEQGRQEHRHDRGPGRVPARRASTRSASTARPGSTFATGLRSVLRADPDVIMVGEIRDAETARIAIEAALTGHMVLTTLHTNDAPGGDHAPAGDGDRVVPHLVGGRLRRGAAPGARALRALQAARRDPAGVADARRASGSATDLEAYEPVGCPRCHGIGYRGRIGIYSVMVLSERIKEMVVQPRPGGRDRQARHRGGDAVRCARSGLAKVRAGLTSIEEVARVAC